MLKKASYLIILLVGSVSVLSCGSADYRRNAVGSIEEMIVVMDSTMWDSETAEAIRDVYGDYVFTLPNPEEFYSLTFSNFKTNSQLDRLKTYKNLIIAAPIDEQTNVGSFVRSLLDDAVEDRVRQEESFALQLNDHWYRDQYAVVLTSVSDSALAAKIRNSKRSLKADAFDREIKRWEAEIYERLEQTDYTDSLWNDHGWSIRIQHDYIKNVDTTNFITFKRTLERNDRWIWAWWQDDVSNINFLDDDWINAKRDSLMEQYIRGSRDNSYIQTEYRRPVETETFQKGRLLAYETQGTWQMINDAMGGPFVNFTYYDPDSRRLFMVEYGQFAPGVKKIRFVKQFRVMGRTFESDSTYVSGEELGSL